ncbi:MAG: PucR family transcriptional regulator ligand-binding domain-containing protein [Quadrisphaera sp.]
MLVTIADVLALPVLAAGRPRVRAGSRQLDTPVRWVHTIDIPDVAGLLQGGELLLSTGQHLKDPRLDLERHVRALHDAGAAGLVVELGPALPHLPQGLVDAARGLRLPLVELAHPVRFVAVTEAVHARLLHEQYAELHFSEGVHRTFAALSARTAPAEDVLHAASAALDRFVVLEDRGHRVVAAAGARGSVDALADWADRSRRAPFGTGTGPSGPERWMTAPVGPAGARWGRLVVPQGASDDTRTRLVLERASETLTLSRLAGHQGPGTLVEEASAVLLRDLLGADAHREEALALRARSLGLPAGALVLPLVVRGLQPAQVVSAAAACAVACLAGGIAPDTTAVVLTARTAEDADRDARALAEAIARGSSTAVLAAAAPVPTFAAAGEGLIEAVHVADAAAAQPGRREPGRVHRAGDLGVVSLLRQLRGDPRLDAYVEGQLGPLLRHPGRAGADLALLRALVASRGSKTRLARATGTSRQHLYSAVARLGERLDRDLDDPDVLCSLHVALLAHELSAGAAPAETTPRG